MPTSDKQEIKFLVFSKSPHKFDTIDRKPISARIGMVISFPYMRLTWLARVG